MSTLTKVALGVIGQLGSRPVKGESRETVKLPAPDKRGGLPLLQAISRRRSTREFERKPLPLPVLSTLVWAAFGENRRGGGRTAPSAINVQEIDIYVALPQGAYLYVASAHTLRLVARRDVRRITGYQDFVDDAPLDLVYVADHRRMRLIPAGLRESYSAIAAGAITQNVYLYAASEGLATV
ncbi:MAG TPA: SagB/ThcOx family dehydrogenase, partial [Steroidobacteraceae bacterium]|nr:SagB/ThcOx family dehydrogenase [Steroidobacteraceae bacterium]